MGKSKHCPKISPTVYREMEGHVSRSDGDSAQIQSLGLSHSITVPGNPMQSPTMSPVIHIRRRRKTLRMLLSRAADPRRRFPSPDDERKIQEEEDPPEKRVRRKLKDLFVSSPLFEDNGNNRDGSHAGLLPVTGCVRGGGSGGFAGRRGGAGALRAVSTTFRHRLMKRAWRPVLVTIPE